MVKSACSLYVLSSSSCDCSSPRMSLIGHAWLSMPSAKGRIMLRTVRVLTHVCRTHAECQSSTISAKTLEVMRRLTSIRLI